MSALSKVETVSWHIDLGGNVCETCGYNVDELDVDYESLTGEIHIRFSVGCYGGEGYTGHSLQEAIKTLRGIQTYGAFDPEEHPSAAMALQDLMCDLSKEVNMP